MKPRGMTLMRYAVIRISDNVWIYESEDLVDIRKQRQEAKTEGVPTVLVRVMDSDEDEDRPDPFDLVDVETALADIVNAANANPEPIHYKVRNAIDRARNAV
jgi:hypothetical protein